MVLAASELRSFYDRFGSKQDAQGFYEDPALDELVAHAGFDAATRVLEFGCGTGRFADRLLTDCLPPSATYVGYDLSRTMVDLATERLARHGARSRVLRSDGSLGFPVPDRSLDRIVSTYVLDLLPESQVREFFRESHRTLRDGGRLCVASLTRGTGLVSGIVSTVWMSVFRLRASWVGGCRPIELLPYVDSDRWTPEYRKVVVACGVPSEVLIARVAGSSPPPAREEYDERTSP